MTELLLYPSVLWAMLFPALLWLCWLSVSVDKQMLYLWIWLLSPLILPVVLVVGLLWYPVKWTMTALNKLGSPLFTITERAIDRARALVHVGIVK